MASLHLPLPLDREARVRVGNGFGDRFDKVHEYKPIDKAWLLGLQEMGFLSVARRPFSGFLGISLLK
jgi:hypothetical protein